MKTRTPWSPILVLLLVLGLLFYLGYISLNERINDGQFLNSFLSDLWATMAGVIVGIPVALFIGHLQQKALENADSRRQIREAEERTARILRLVRAELAYNLNPVGGNVKLKDEMWQTLSDGGELKYIETLELLDTISTAYYHIRVASILRQKFYEADHNPTMPSGPVKAARDRILQDVSEQEDSLRRAIEEALKQISKHIG
ncbi:MAG: hypothetical protein AB1791_19915 [Chloroflexota bacterium]